MIEVLDSGKLALTSGPVVNPQGELTGRFTSIWRRNLTTASRASFSIAGVKGALPLNAVSTYSLARAPLPCPYPWVMNR